jgi:hypothetical protein
VLQSLATTERQLANGLRMRPDRIEMGVWAELVFRFADPFLPATFGSDERTNRGKMAAFWDEQKFKRSAFYNHDIAGAGERGADDEGKDCEEPEELDPMMRARLGRD